MLLENAVLEMFVLENGAGHGACCSRCGAGRRGGDEEGGGGGGDDADDGDRIMLCLAVGHCVRRRVPGLGVTSDACKLVEMPALYDVGAYIMYGP